MGNVIQFGALGGFSMGQVLSLPMIALGLVLPHRAPASARRAPT